MTSNEIRQQFIDFFVQKHGHTFVPSSPVVPLDDPTLLFTNAGMNQFKPIFLGQEKRSYTRAANTQKCIRAGGKHNDLDDVGRSRRHHTFFEMLGNWSFGDYFKRGAIEMAWELLTKVWKLDPTRLHVSCYQGDEKAGIPRDTEAAGIWKEVARLPDDHIHYFGKDNFWEMGDTGPCGPCTEIYIDRTPDKTGGKDVNGEDPRVMEIWNLVFIQYNRDATGKLTILPSQHVDTGMGLERVCQVIQGKEDNYATDLWKPLFDRISEISNLKYTGKFPRTNAADPVAESADPQLRHDIAFRVVADHVRCLTFALTDGAVPSNEGRGYVLRRILRRAVRFGRQQLELHEPFLHKLVPPVVDSMGNAFPELRRDPSRVADLIRDEEVSFGVTLDRGIQLFEDAAEHAVEQYARGIALRKEHPELDELSTLEQHLTWPQSDLHAWRASLRGAPAISGVDAFKLHDTYGFPIDLTRIMAEERGMAVDVSEFEQLMIDARERARSAKGSSVFRLKNIIAVIEDVNDSPKYGHDAVQALITGIVTPDFSVTTQLGRQVEGAIGVLLRTTPFYAEQGGQVGDTGVIKSSEGIFRVENTVHQWNNVLHLGRTEWGVMRVGDIVVAKVDDSRLDTEKNHTSTHLANWALREVLGDDVQQKGSLVDPEKLRFDFSHSKAMSDEEIAGVETLVNEAIGLKMQVYAEEAPQEKALKINGLRAVFGEKYPPMVRVVSIGVPVKDLLADPANTKWRQYSIEFCGGTHLRTSAEAQNFVITQEESISKGIRRLLALTGEAAARASALGTGIDSMIRQGKSAGDAELAPLIASLQKAITGTIPLRAKRRAQAAIAELQSRHKAHEKAVKSAPAARVDVGSISDSLLSSAQPLGAAKLIVGQVPGIAPDQLLSVVDSLKKKAGSYAIFVATVNDGRITFVCAVSDDLVQKGLKAGDWLREAAMAAGGKGGGRPQLAQGSGSEPAKLPDALQAASDFALAAIK